MVEDREKDFSGILARETQTVFHELCKGIFSCMIALFKAGETACGDMDLDDRAEDVAVAEVIPVIIQDIRPGRRELIRGKGLSLRECGDEVIEAGLHLVGTDLEIDLFLCCHIFIEVCPCPGQLSGNGGECDLLVGDGAEEFIRRGLDLSHAGLFLFFTSRTYKSCHGITS